MSQEYEEDLTRPLMTNRLRLEVCYDICENPGMSSREIIDRAIERNPRDVIYFGSKKVKDTLTLAQQHEILNAKSKAAARKLYDQYLDRSVRFEINTSVVNRMKTWWNKSYIKTDDSAMPIYGAVGMGYISEDKLTPKTAAKWMYPRLKQLQHEGFHWDKCVRLVEDGSDTTTKEDVSKKLRKWMNKAVSYNTLKGISSGIKKEFIS